MSKTTIRLMGRAARANAIEILSRLAEGWTVTFAPPKRSSAQNDKLWATLTDVSKQVDWHGQKLEPSEWKDVFTAAQKRQKVVPGIDGGFVVLGSSTSRMTKGELSELIELIQAFGAQHGVTFADENAGAHLAVPEPNETKNLTEELS